MLFIKKRKLMIALYWLWFSLVSKKKLLYQKF